MSNVASSGRGLGSSNAERDDIAKAGTSSLNHQSDAKEIVERLSPRMARGTRREGRDDSCIPDVQPVVSSVHPEVVIDRSFWVESIAVFQALVSDNAPTSTSSASPPHRLVTGAPSATSPQNDDVGSPHTIDSPIVDAPKLTQENVVLAGEGSVQAFHKQLFRKHMALAGLAVGPTSSPPPPRQEDAALSSTTEPPLLTAEAAKAVDMRGLQRMLESIGANCNSDVVTALIKLVQYATLDLRTLIRERSNSPGRVSATGSSSVSADRLNVARVSQLLRAVSTVIARRLVAVKLFHRHSNAVAMGSESVASRRGSLFKPTASAAAEDDESAAAAAAAACPLSPMMPSPPSIHNLAAIDDMLQEALAVTRHRSREGLSRAATSTTTPPRRGSSNPNTVGSASTPLRRDSTSTTTPPRRGSSNPNTVGSAINVNQSASTPLRRDSTSTTPSVVGPRSVAGGSIGGASSLRRANGSSEHGGGGGGMSFVPTRAYLLRSDPNVRSPTLDVNGRRPSSPARHQQDLLRRASPVHTSTSTLNQQHSGIVRRSSDGTASPRRGRDGLPSSAASVCSGASTPTRCRSPTVATKSSTPTTTVASAVGFNKTHHDLHVARAFGHVSGRVQHMHMSAVLHDPNANPFTIRLATSAASSPPGGNYRPSPTRRDGSGASSTPRRGVSPTLHHHDTLGKAHLKHHTDAAVHGYGSGVHRSLGPELRAQQQQAAPPLSKPVPRQMVAERSIKNDDVPPPPQQQQRLPKTIPVPSFRKALSIPQPGPSSAGITADRCGDSSDGGGVPPPSSADAPSRATAAWDDVQHDVEPPVAPTAPVVVAPQDNATSTPPPQQEEW